MQTTAKLSVNQHSYGENIQEVPQKTKNRITPWGSKMTQWVRFFAVKPYTLTSSPGSHMVGEEDSDSCPLTSRTHNK